MDQEKDTYHQLKKGFYALQRISKAVPEEYHKDIDTLNELLQSMANQFFFNEMLQEAFDANNEVYFCENCDKKTKHKEELYEVLNVEEDSFEVCTTYLGNIVCETCGSITIKDSEIQKVERKGGDWVGRYF